MKRLCKEADTSSLHISLQHRRQLGAVLLVCCLGGVYGTFSLLEDVTLNFIPSMFQIGIGLSMMYLVIITLRVQAADELNKKGVDVEFVRRWRQQIGDSSKKISAVKMPGPGAIVARLRERVAKIAPSLRRKGPGGGVDVQMV